MREWLRRNKAYFMIGVLLIVARLVQVVIFLYFDDMRDLITNVLGIFGG